MELTKKLEIERGQGCTSTKQLQTSVDLSGTNRREVPLKGRQREEEEEKIRGSYDESVFSIGMKRKTFP